MQEQGVSGFGQLQLPQQIVASGSHTSPAGTHMAGWQLPPMQALPAQQGGPPPTLLQ